MSDAQTLAQDQLLAGEIEKLKRALRVADDRVARLEQERQQYKDWRKEADDRADRLAKACKALVDTLGGE